MDLHERICRYLAACPPAIEHENGSGRTFAVACALWNGFSLDTNKVVEYLTLYNSRCQPEWSERELLHKAEDAAKAQHTKKRGHLIGGNGKFSADDFKPSSFPAKVKEERSSLDPSTEIETFLRGFRCSENDLIDASPIRPSEDWTQDGSVLVSHLYQQGELINFVTAFKLHTAKDGSVKAIPNGNGRSVDRDELAATWALSGMPQSEAGGWMRMNPTDGAGVTDGNITAFRYILFEFDSIPFDLQMALFSKLPIPIAAVLTSGGKSLHAWVKSDCRDIVEYKSTVERLFGGRTPGLLTRFGLDTKNKNPSRLSRLVGVTRTIGAADDGRQRLLYLSPNPTMKAIL